MKVLVIGPSIKRSKGGMASVIFDISQDKELVDKYNIDFFESYIDTNKFISILFSILQLIKFYCFKRDYDLYHIHVASRGSTFRKILFLNIIKKWKKKVIVHIHGAQYVEFYNEQNLKNKTRVKNFLNDADLVIALSESWKITFNQLFGLKNCVVLENGVNTDFFLEARINNEKNYSNFAVLGRLGERKGTYDLIRAFKIVVKKIPEARCYLAGDGEIDKVKELINQEKLNKNIILLGWISAEKKIELLQNVSTIVLPSYNEGLPMSILEGMASGKAIISTRVGAIPEVIEKQNGVLIAPGDVESLALSMIKLATNPTLLATFSENNIKKVECSYSINVMHKKLSEYYNLVLEK